ncbi:MAG: nucleotidyltransferase domain-containing protein [Nitrospirota bacterium]
MNLSQKERDIIKEFKNKAMKQYPGEIINVIVFGSKARGDASEESDIDILVVIKSDNWRTGDNIRDIGYELELKHDLILSIQVVSQKHIAHLKNIRSQFIRNIEREGVAL